MIECLTSTQVITEVERNFEKKLPKKLPELRLIISRCLRVLPDPKPHELTPYRGQADPLDLPILVAAIQHGCRYLLTFNLRHYHPVTSDCVIQRPADFLTAIRTLLVQLAAKTEKTS